MVENVVAGGSMFNGRRLFLVLTGAAILVPLVSLAGWLAGIPRLASYGDRFIPMAPSTAICFIFLALPLAIMLGPRHLPGERRAAVVAGVLVAGYGLLAALDGLFGLPLNPDHLLFAQWRAQDVHPLGQMSPMTGFFFILSALALVSLVRGLSRERTGSSWLSLAGLAGSLVLLGGTIFVLGYAFGDPLLYRSRVIPLALPTSLSFFLLGGALTIATVLYSPLKGRWLLSLRELRIGTQLRLGLGIILAFVVLLGFLAWRTTDLLWLRTKQLYDHPQQVRRAIGQLEVDTQSMSMHVRDMLLARDDEEIATALQKIELDKADAGRWFAVLHDRYLGPRADIAALEEEFVKWNVLRDETIRLLRADETARAKERIRPGGAQNLQVQAVWSRLRTINEFAKGKGDQIYREATEQKDLLNRQLAVIVSAILLFSLVVSYFLLRGIKEPLRILTTAVEQFRRGRREVRSEYASANEFGQLSVAFNTLADTIDTRLRIEEQAAHLAMIMLRETEAHSFCREVLKFLVENTGSRIGAIYLLDRQKSEFEHYESIGLGSGGRASFPASVQEGEFGVALATGKMQRITAIPADTRFTFAAVSGEFRPREIITLPVLAGQETVALISLASLREYDKSAVRLLEGVLDTLAARINGVLAFRQIQELAELLGQQNRELEAQKRELAAQTNELTEMNTELEMQKRELGEASRLKSAFLSKMSHELRTPLNSVIALAGVLNRRLANKIPDEEFEYLEVIERNGKHLLELINDILDLSRIEAGREEICLRRFSIRNLVGEVVAMLEPQAREKNIVLGNEVGDDLPLLTSDPDKCRHILLNLVGNAVKFTDAGSVRISARQTDGELHVAVRDTGIGITADQLPHIFDEFRQADDSASRKYGGTGLGLAIAGRYAALLHGGIRVESTPGQGSTFTLRLPIVVPPADTAADSGMAYPEDAGSTAPGPCATSGQGYAILVVEDSEPAVIQMTDILAGQGYAVRVARNGHEALAQIEKNPPDAVILDLMMPEMDGFAVLRQIRVREKSARLPVLILTAKHVTREELGFLKGNHIHQLIQKGDVSRQALLATVAKMVARPPAGPAPSPMPAVRGPSGDRPLILVVEDNPDNMQTMRALLRDTCSVLEAVDGLAAIEQARHHKPDLILMDLAMPVMDGFTALARLREDEAMRHIPVVAVTASAMMGDREEVLAHGFDGYISKPVDEELLRKTMREVLHGSR
jgi:signal transduction histidine kinase/DNA-binding response OmpR family regulator/HAMP domain-containing protein